MDKLFWFLIGASMFDKKNENENKADNQFNGKVLRKRTTPYTPKEVAKEITALIVVLIGIAMLLFFPMFLMKITSNFLS